MQEEIDKQSKQSKNSKQTNQSNRPASNKNQREPQNNNLKSPSHDNQIKNEGFNQSLNQQGTNSNFRQTNNKDYNSDTNFNRDQQYLNRNNQTGLSSQRDTQQIVKVQATPRMDALQYEHKIQELLELVEIQESKINSQHEQKLKLTNKLREIENDNLKNQNKIGKLNEERLNQGREIVDLSQKVLDMNSKYQVHSEHARNKLDFINRDLDEKAKNINNLNSDLESKNTNLKKALVINDFTQIDNAHLKNELEYLKKEKNIAEDRIKELENKLDDMYLTRKSETALLLEINHLKDDNIRLLNMLKTTEEFKDFAYLAEDCSGGVRYVKSGSMYSDGMNKCNCSKGAVYPNGKACKCTGSHDVLSNKKNPVVCKIKECVYKKLQEDTPFNDSNWVPVQAFECARSFANKYRLNIDDSLAKELLYKLNLIWKEREAKQVQRIKSKYQTEILDLRRKINNKEPMDQILTKTENKILKQDVKNSRLDGGIMNKKNDGLDMVNSALKVASTFHKTKSALEAEITKLKKLIDNKENSNEKNQNMERLKFNEGALWLINRVCNEIETFNIKIDECKNDYDKRLQGMALENELNRMIFTNSKSWLFNSLSIIGKDMIKVFTDWRDNAQRNVDATK